jgi:hypothetical protein
MISIISIEKNGNLYEKNIKTIDKLYSVCNYRTDKDFEKIHQWTNGNDEYILYGKKIGKKNNQNNYNLPNISIPLYGNLCIIKKDGLITLDIWNSFYMQHINVNLKNTYQNNDINDINYINYINDLNDISDESDIELTYEDYEEEL